jgi:hypothetical protein
MTNVRYQGLVVLYDVLALGWRRDSGAAPGLVVPLYLLFASTYFVMERTFAATFTRPVRAWRR